MLLIYIVEAIRNANPNLAVLKEYRKREQEFLNRAKDLEEVTNLRDGQKAKYDGLRKQRLDEFMTGFNAISAKLKEMYQVRFLVIPGLRLLIDVAVLDDHPWRKCGA